MSILFGAGDSGLHNDTSSRDHGMEGDDKAGQKQQTATVPAAEPFEDSATPTVATYDCPVCRKAHVLDLDRLQVLSQRLSASILNFVEWLHLYFNLSPQCHTQ